MKIAARDVGGAFGIAVTALLGGTLLGMRTSTELDYVRGIRTTLDARAALKNPKKVEGELTIVKSVESTKYYFLNKKSWVVHTSSTTREGTALRGDVPEDKARADRHAQVARTKSPLRERLPDGSWRVTVPEGDRSGELLQNPPPIPVPAPWRAGLEAVVLGLVAMVLLRFRAKAKIAAPIGAVVAGIAIVYFAGAHLQLASTAATNYLSAGRGNAPIVAFPVQIPRLMAGAGALFGVALTFFLASDLAARTFAASKEDRHAYLAVAPAMVGLALLVGIPFLFGIGLAFFHHVHGTYTFVGLDNFIAILGSSGRSWFEPQSLPYSLVLTIGWTLANVVFHLSIGLFLALLLQNRAPRASKIYRLLLIVPWAVPAYLTALIWRSMFDPDIGVMNRLLGLEGFSWMHQTSTAFLANLITNVWLGFPFMMVVSLGALTSIPKELYEAAEVDGASDLQQFARITLPLLQPALLPAVILGSIWTFNKFEVIYLVSEGRPDGATEILVTEAYKWAFERGGAQGGAYGYAAAYSVIIFAVLLLYGWMTSRVSKAAEEALR
jgi:ABC-type sugar transport system permease subunit